MSEQKKQSKQEHHHEWYAREFKENKYEAACLLIEFRSLINKAGRFIGMLEGSEACRQENAVLMGVPVVESNRKYGAGEIKAQVETMVKELKEMDKLIGGESS